MQHRLVLTELQSGSHKLGGTGQGGTAQVVLNSPAWLGMLHPVLVGCLHTLGQKYRVQPEPAQFHGQVGWVEYRCLQTGNFLQADKASPA